MLAKTRHFCTISQSFHGRLAQVDKVMTFWNNDTALFVGLGESAMTQSDWHLIVTFIR